MGPNTAPLLPFLLYALASCGGLAEAPNPGERAPATEAPEPPPGIAGAPEADAEQESQPAGLCPRRSEPEDASLSPRVRLSKRLWSLRNPCQRAVRCGSSYLNCQDEYTVVECDDIDGRELIIGETGLPISEVQKAFCIDHRRTLFAPEGPEPSDFVVGRIEGIGDFYLVPSTSGFVGCEYDVYGCFDAPRRAVSVREYWIAPGVVEQVTFDLVLGRTPTQCSGCHARPRGRKEALRFVQALSRSLGFQGCYGADGKRNGLRGCGFRLPTSEEWELAFFGPVGGNLIVTEHVQIEIVDGEFCPHLSVDPDRCSPWLVGRRMAEGTPNRSRTSEEDRLDDDRFNGFRLVLDPPAEWLDNLPVRLVARSTVPRDRGGSYREAFKKQREKERKLFHE